MIKVGGYIIRLDTAQNNLNNGITNGPESSIHADFFQFINIQHFGTKISSEDGELFGSNWDTAQF
jgi:hypothetical protein